MDIWEGNEKGLIVDHGSIELIRATDRGKKENARMIVCKTSVTPGSNIPGSNRPKLKVFVSFFDQTPVFELANRCKFQAGPRLKM